MHHGHCCVHKASGARRDNSGAEISRSPVNPMAERTPSWHANHSVEERKAFLAALINAIPTPVLVKDERHVYIAVNEAFQAFFHRSAEKIIGKNDFDFFSLRTLSSIKIPIATRS